MMLRKLSERRFTTSVDSFHRQLRGLRRAYPRLAASAADPEAMLFVENAEDYESQTGYSHPDYMSRNRAIDRSGQRLTLQAARRRRVLSVLVGTTLGFLVLGMIPALRV